MRLAFGLVPCALPRCGSNVRRRDGVKAPGESRLARRHDVRSDYFHGHLCVKRTALFARQRFSWNSRRRQTFLFDKKRGDVMLKGLLLWALGVPFFVVVLLYMFVF